jgi:hypothetical protein
LYGPPRTSVKPAAGQTSSEEQVFMSPEVFLVVGGERVVVFDLGVPGQPRLIASFETPPCLVAPRIDGGQALVNGYRYVPIGDQGCLVASWKPDVP